ncbi:unnamed protein product [marine sediment metagenome]|uniref:Leucine-binding protein domain-containing protein n=1 Tax=marine sediment metagenome TaxID=412755 RepID=X1BUK8_9ZZZZ
MKNLKSLLVIILAFFLVMTFCFPAWSAKKIKIGVIGPMQFVQGKGHWNGAVMAAEEISQSHVIFGGFRSGSR